MRSALVRKLHEKQSLERTVTVLVFTNEGLGVLGHRVHEEQSKLLEDPDASTSVLYVFGVAWHKKVHTLLFP